MTRDDFQFAIERIIACWLADRSLVRSLPVSPVNCRKAALWVVGAYQRNMANFSNREDVCEYLSRAGWNVSYVSPDDVLAAQRVLDEGRVRGARNGDNPMRSSVGRLFCAAFLGLLVVASVCRAAPPGGNPVTLPSIHVVIPDDGNGGGTWDSGAFTWSDSDGEYYTGDTMGQVIPQGGSLYSVFLTDPADPYGNVSVSYVLNQGSGNLSSMWTGSLQNAWDGTGTALPDLSGVDLTGGGFRVGAVPEPASVCCLMPMAWLGLSRRRLRRMSSLRW